MNVSVAVVGSANLDIVAHAPQAPGPGETVLGTTLAETEGGKGANQAIAAATHAATAFVGCVGDDAAGLRLRSRLEGSGVHTGALREVPGPSGHAIITVSGDGENRIIVIPGANAALTPGEVTAALEELHPTVVLSQLEVDLAAVHAAARWARAAGATFMLNPSPMRPLAAEFLSLVDVLIVNVGEARALLAARGAEPPTPDADGADPRALARALHREGQTIIVTAGARGAALAGPGGDLIEVPGVSVAVVDTTGAGDIFAGTVAGLLAQGADLGTSVRAANAAAAAAVARPRDDR